MPVSCDSIAEVEKRELAFDDATTARVIARIAGKLPGETLSASYTLEYGTATIEVHTGALQPGDRVLVVDDVLATGGTAAACVQLVREAGAEVAGVEVVLELGFLDGRAALEDVGVDVVSLLVQE